MNTANAITNGTGGRISAADSKIENVNGTYILPAKIAWSDSRTVNLGDLYSDDKWSLLVQFVLKMLGSDASLRSKCLISKSAGLKRLEIKGFEYILKKSRITRRPAKKQGS